MAYRFDFTLSFGEPTHIEFADELHAAAFGLRSTSGARVTCDFADRPFAELMADDELVEEAYALNAYYGRTFSKEEAALNATLAADHLARVNAFQARRGKRAYQFAAAARVSLPLERAA